MPHKRKTRKRLTDAKIAQAMHLASRLGQTGFVTRCVRALNGDEKARQSVARVIRGN